MSSPQRKQSVWPQRQPSVYQRGNFSCGAVGVLTYEMDTRPSSRLAILFSNPFNYKIYDQTFVLHITEREKHSEENLASLLTVFLTALSISPPWPRPTCTPHLLRLLLLGALCLQPAYAGSHSYRSLYSSLSQSMAGLPQFSVVTYVDDVVVERYTSETRRMEPRAPWMENINSEDPQYWERESRVLQINENVQRANVKIIRTRLNQTGGLHSVQKMYGCELREDGSVGGFDQYAYDGQDMISFDKDRLMFTAAMSPARISVDGWNSDRSENQRVKNYLEKECIEYLKKYLKYGEESLQRKARPKFRVSRRMAETSSILIFYAYGFYPKEIQVKWVRNGVEMPWKSKQILPHPDGTYQVKMTVELHEGDEERDYTWQVDHSSLEEIVSLPYMPTEKDSPKKNIWAIAGVVPLVILLVAAAIGVFVFWKKKVSGNMYPDVSYTVSDSKGSSSSSCSA